MRGRKRRAASQRLNILALIAACALELWSPQHAQAQIGQVTNPASAPLYVQDAGTCSTPNSFLIQQLPLTAGTTTLNLSGTFSATVTVRESNNGGATWTTAGTISSAGTSSYSTNGFTQICADVTAYTSGTVIATLGTGVSTTVVQQQVAGGGNVGPVIYAAASKYGLPATGYFSCVANYSNSSTTLATDSTTDVPFTPAMVGWQVFVSNGACQFENGAETGTVHYNGTIAAFIDAHHVTLGGTPSGTCAGSQSGGVSCRAYWFPSDSAAALNSAWADATAFRGQCPTLVLPVGVYKFNTAITSSTMCGPILGLATGLAYNGPSVTGQGQASTILVADPAFNANTCVGDNGCVFGLPAGLQNFNISNMTVSGGGNATVTNGNGKCKVASPTWPSSIENVQLDYWGYATSGFTGLCWTGTNQGQSFIKNVNIYNGGFSGATITNSVTVVGLMVFTPAGSTVTGGNVYIYGSSFSAGAAGGPALAFSESTPTSPYLLSGSQVVGSTNNGSVQDSADDPLYVEDSVLTSSAGTNVLVGNTGTGKVAQMYVRNTRIAASGGTNIGGTQAGSAFYDQGGNTYSGANTLTNVQTINENLSANQVPVTAAKLVLSANWGTGAADSALSGGDAPIQFTVTNGSASTGASPTVTYTFPTPYLVSPFSCTATQIGGTNPTGTFASSALSATGVTFTFSLTPTASDTEIIQVTCVTP